MLSLTFTRTEDANEMAVRMVAVDNRFSKIWLYSVVVAASKMASSVSYLLVVLLLCGSFPH